MATVSVEKLSSVPVRLPPNRAGLLLSDGCKQQFNLDKHLAYCPPSRRISLTELGLQATSTDNNNSAPACLDFAVTEPFRLASAAGVQALRDEIFSAKVLDHCAVQITERSGVTVNHWQLRNPAKYSQFILDFWRNLETTRCIADAIQYDVCPTMDLECGHVNFQMPDVGLPDHETSSDGWHTDSNCQFVAILMLSDTREMVGGETGIRKGDGTTMKMRYPEPGMAICLQGMNIWHAAMHVASAAGERLTMVTSYQPASHSAPQNAVLSGVRFYSDETQLFAEWCSWRFRVLSGRMADLADQVEAERRERGRFSLEDIKRKAKEFQSFLDKTLHEML